MSKILPTVIGLLTLLLTGCAKDNVIKEPSQVEVYFALDSTGVGGSDRLTLNSGSIVLQEIEVEGKRKKGKTFQFRREFPNGLHLDFNTTNRVEELIFDLPQGDYEQLMIRFTTLEQSTKGCLMVLGKYTYRSSTDGSVWVEIAWNSRKVFEQIVKTTEGVQEFTLGKHPKRITLSIQPKLWFKDVSELKLEQAFCKDHSHGQAMPINNGYNENVFQAIDAALGTTLKASL